MVLVKSLESALTKNRGRGYLFEYDSYDGNED